MNPLLGEVVAGGSAVRWWEWDVDASDVLVDVRERAVARSTEADRVDRLGSIAIKEPIEVMPDRRGFRWL